jgi:NADH-quinone oxidoreductase subunit F
MLMKGNPELLKIVRFLAYDPHFLLKGMAISAYALGCKTAFIYIRGEFSWIATFLKKRLMKLKRWTTKRS